MEVIVHPNKKETKIIGEKDGVLILEVKGKPENNQANNEITEFLSKKYNKQVKIVKGLKNKKKTLKFI